MRLTVLISLMFISSIGFSQLTAINTTQIIQKVQPDVSSSEQYVIGIGNAESSTYTNILDFLQNDNSIEVYAICERHNIIGFKVLNNTYKSYDVIEELLLTELEDLILLRKTDAIFTKDCSDEILKQ